jgi:hypothetical protein
MGHLHAHQCTEADPRNSTNGSQTTSASYAYNELEDGSSPHVHRCDFRKFDHGVLDFLPEKAKAELEAEKDWLSLCRPLQS